MVMTAYDIYVIINNFIFIVFYVIFIIRIGVFFVTFLSIIYFVVLLDLINDGFLGRFVKVIIRLMVNCYPIYYYYYYYYHYFFYYYYLILYNYTLTPYYYNSLKTIFP
jgi:hypothetical protein